MGTNAKPTISLFPLIIVLLISGTTPAAGQDCELPGAIAVWQDEDLASVLSIVGERIVLMACNEVRVGNRSYRTELAGIHHSALQIDEGPDGEEFLVWGRSNLGSTRQGVCGENECRLEIVRGADFPDPLYYLRIEAPGLRPAVIEFRAREPPVLHRVY